MIFLGLAALYLQTAQQVRAADAAFRAGYAAMQAGDLRRADAEFAKVVRLTPTVGAGHSAYGAVLLAEGKGAAAVVQLEQAHRLDGKDDTATLNLAMAYSEQTRAAEAVRTFRLLTPEVSLTPDAEMAYARALVGTGQLLDATERLRAAVARYPESAVLRDGLGSVLAQQGLYDDALQEFLRAVQADRGFGPAAMHLGSLYLVRGDVAAAVTALAQAAARLPGDVQVLLQLGRAQRAAQRDEAALQTLRHAHELAPGDTTVEYELALTLQNTGRSKEALPLFAAAAAAKPNDGATLINDALALVQTGDAAHAVPLYERALALEPSSPTLREDLGVAYLQQSDLDHAMEQFRAGLALPGEGAPLSAALHYDLGLALKLKDQLPAAIAEFERAEAMDASLPDPPFTLGILYMQTGRVADAAVQMERATALRPENGEAWSVLGNIYKQAEQPEKAIVALRRAIPLLPGQPSPHITLAALLSQQGDREGAAEERKIGADLSRVAVSRQKAEFALKSGMALMQQGKLAEAVGQLRASVAADPGYADAHAALAQALAKQGKPAEAALERQKAEAQTK